ncbi:MAG: chromate transporter, partial [Acidobacteriota bacterium]|nr:chromate transporter [Acidobacteriota bacterium]
MPPVAPAVAPRVALITVLREWGRIGVIGFGGPPAHIALLRTLVVTQRGWLEPDEFEAAIAACNLLPGPASTQLAIFCAYRVAGRRGALVGGLAFILPAVVCVVALSLLFLAS